MSEDNPFAPAPPPKELLEAPAHPAPPPPPHSAEAEPLNDFLRNRLETTEIELSKERDKARRFEGMLRQQEAVRSETDRQLKAILEQLKVEKNQRDREDEKSHDQG